MTGACRLTRVLVAYIKSVPCPADQDRMRLLSLVLLSVAANGGVARQKKGETKLKIENPKIENPKSEKPKKTKGKVNNAPVVVVASVPAAAAHQAAVPQAAVPQAAAAAPQAAVPQAAAARTAPAPAAAAAVQPATDNAPANLSSQKEAEPETAQAVSTAPTGATSVGTVVGFVLVAGLIMSVIGFVTVKKLRSRRGEKEEDDFAPPKQSADIGFASSREMPPARDFEADTVDFPSEKRSFRDSTISDVDSLHDGPVAGDSGLLSMLNKV